SISSPGMPSVSPSTPTPKPQALGTLPTRGSLRGLPPTPPKETTFQTEPNAEHAEAGRSVPGAEFDEDEKSWEERLGPFGIVLSTVAACALVYLLAVWFKVF